MTMTMKDFVAEARARVDTIAPAEAQQAARDGALILDVREPGELQAAGRIDGALNVPRGVLEPKADADGEPRLRAMQGEGRVLVLCASGGRATLAADALNKMGYRASVIEGGLAGWKEAGLPIEG